MSDNDHLPVICIDCESVIVQMSENDELVKRHHPSCVTLLDENSTKIYQKLIKIESDERYIKNVAVHGLPVSYHQQNAYEREIVARQVVELLKGKIIVGFGVNYFLTILRIKDQLPENLIRDLRKARMFLVDNRYLSLPEISRLYLQRGCTRAKNSTAEHCVAIMEVYKLLPNADIEIDWSRPESERLELSNISI